MMKMKKLARHILSFRLGREQGAIALAMVLAFMVLAVPISLAAVRLADQLAVSSRVYDSRMTGHYSASSGIEYAIWQVVSDPTFDDDLTPDNPSKETVVESSGESVTITVTKIFTSIPLVGQGLVVTKTVDPSTALEQTLTTFTYTITITNEGTDTAELVWIRDYLPPKFSYVPGSTGGDITTFNPDITYEAGQVRCGDKPDLLEWAWVSNRPQILAWETRTLTFQATATLPDGTFYNQAGLAYIPWWDLDPVYVYTTPSTAPVSVGTGQSECSFNLRLIVNKEVDIREVEPGVPTEFTYTISIENADDETMYICEIEDLLPPYFSYVAGSSSDITTDDPVQEWDAEKERWKLRWTKEGTSCTSDCYLDSLASGETRTQVFKATASVEPGIVYFNDAGVDFSDDPGDCPNYWGWTMGLGWGSQATTSGFGSVNAAPLYDVAAVAADGTVLARILVSELDGAAEILSWQY